MSPEKHNSVTLETDILQDVSAEQLWKSVQYLATFDKTSGTEGEYRAFEYIVEQLAKYGVKTETIVFESYLSHPVEASLTLIEPTKKVFEARPPSFSQTTPPEGISGSLVDLGHGTEEEFKKEDVTNKIVMVEGLASPDIAWLAQQAGAVALIATSPDGPIREMIVTTIWGTPTKDSAKRIPKIPAISITKQDGEYLRTLKDPRVLVKAKTSTAWRTTRIPVAHIPGPKTSDKFVFIEGHYDSWHEGVTDNSTGTACKLELARIFQKHQDKLDRSVRIAWWPGHSTGRYSGSTYYVDHNWQDLYDNAIAHLNVDSPGCLNSKKYEIRVTAELEQFEKTVVTELSEEDIHISRPSRNSDQSFYGLGIPALGASPKIFFAEKGPMPVAIDKIWWHTTEDTLDKADKELLVRDTQLYTALVFRLCNAPILPFDFQNTVKDFQTTLEALQKEVEDTIDFSTPLKYCDALTKQISLFDEILGSRVQPLVATGGEKVETILQKINNCLMGVSRTLNSVLYSKTGKFEQDPAGFWQLLPGLQPATQLPKLDPRSNEFRFLKTQLVRERNRVVHAFCEAITLLTEKALQIEARLK